MTAVEHYAGRRNGVSLTFRDEGLSNLPARIIKAPQSGDRVRQVFAGD